MTIKIRKTKSGYTITAKGLRSGVHLRDFVLAQGNFESGANAAADSPALAKSSHEEAAQGAENV
ncbi:hypothetical protein ACLJYM_06315 [Rhizobium giardinii]|uniref:hypothetical protein n=1 Tax=Rhizobium giardinii TaxID=56731 RepID=UPI0039DF3CA1